MNKSKKFLLEKSNKRLVQDMIKKIQFFSYYYCIEHNHIDFIKYNDKLNYYQQESLIHIVDFQTHHFLSNGPNLMC